MCWVCTNGSVLGQQDLLSEIYRFRSLLVYFKSHDLGTAPMDEKEGFSAPEIST